jgi:hypothetical protein
MKVILSIVAISLIILGFLVFAGEQTVPSLEKPKIVAITSISKPIFTASPKRTQTKTEQKAKQENMITRDKIDIYNTLSIEEASLQYKPRSYVKPLTAIALNQHSLAIGDTMLLPNIEGIDYEILISHIAINSDGSKSITGSYSDEGIPYTTTMTQSDNDTFISLATTEGAYEIETRKGIGYIYKTHEIRKVMQTSTLNDTIILPSNSTSQAIE